MSEPPDEPPDDDDGDENEGDNVLLFPDPAIDEHAERLEDAAAINPRRLAEEHAFLEMQRAQVIERSVAAERAEAAAQRLARRLKVAGVVGALLFVAGLVYVVERGAAAARAQLRADELALAQTAWPADFAWRMIAGANDFTPLPGQKRAPCAADEMESGGYCWTESVGHPPCSSGKVEGRGKCYVPTPGHPLTPGRSTEH